jgi:succinyl-CoA synthetase beta subunit
MKLLEYEAKRILKISGISVPTSEIIKEQKTSSFSLPFVLKSQVPIGGRSKAGGIVVVENQDEIEATVNKILKLPIKGFVPKVLLAEEKIAIKHEYYLSILVDRVQQQIVIMAHKSGGIKVEENDTNTFWNGSIDDNPDFGVLGQSLADYYNLPGQAFALQGLLENLYNCFVQNDATLIEINPLILTTDDKLIAGDCKMVLDDAAAFRHEWSFEEKPVEANFVTLEPHGNIATIANGAGLAMATVDAAYDYGLKPANFLDIGGGANVDTLLLAFRRILEYPHIKAIVINIFAGITRCDEVARAIVAAREQINSLPPLFIRLAGTGFEQAVPILEAAQIAILPNLEECLDAAKKEVSRE